MQEERKRSGSHNPRLSDDEISEDVQTELKKLEEKMDAVFRGMCRRSPPVFLSRDLKAAM